MELVKLSKTPCGGCVLVGNHLKDLGVEHTEIDIFDDEAVEKKFNLTSEEFREEYDITSVPVLLLLDDDGVELARVNGFNPPAIEALLKTM
jgi:hypothetical protein